MSSFTYVQSLLLALMPKLTATLSLIGSFSIVYEVIRDKTKLSKVVYHRLMMMMSIWDINVSIWFFMSTWPIPSESTNVVWNVGNTATCSTQGFCIQLFGVLALLYNAMLGLYYLLQIKYSWRCETFRTKLKLNKLCCCGGGRGGGIICCITTEQLLHILPWSWGISTAISGLVLKLYNNATLWCWIASYPTGCNSNDDIDCTRGENAWMFQWIFWYGPLWIAVFFSLWCMIMMYLSVRETERNVNKWRPSNEYGGGANNNNNNNNANNGKYNGQQQQQQQQNTTTTTTTTSTTIESTTTATGGVGTKEFNEVEPSSAAAAENGDSNNNNNADDIEEHQQHEEGQKKDEIGSSIKKRYQRMKTIKNDRMKTIKDKYNRNMQRSKTSRRVFKQAMFYILSFYLAWTPATFNRLMQAIHGKTYYSLALLHTITGPLQGFFNYCVYLRPRILEYHQKYRTRRNSSSSSNDKTPSLWQIIKWAIGKSYGREPPPPPQRMQRQLRPRIQQQQQQQQQNYHNSGGTNNNDTNNGNGTDAVVVVVATDDILPNQETKHGQKKEKTSWLGKMKNSKKKINDDDSESDASSINSANGAYMPSTHFEIIENEEEKSYPANNNDETIPNNSKEES